VAKRHLAELDFETEAIEDLPNYPPVPLGVAIRGAWHQGPVPFLGGHATNNNCQQGGSSRESWLGLWRSDATIAMHHGKFDQCVAHEHFGLALPAA